MGERWLYGLEGGLERGPVEAWADEQWGPEVPPSQPRVTQVFVREPPHEAMLHWLERVVGGAAALESLDADPLMRAEPLDVSTLRPGDVERAGVVDEHLTAAGPAPIVPGELLTAYRRLLVEAAHVGLLRHWRAVPPERVAAAVIHCVVKANLLTGPAGAFRVKDFIEGLGVEQAPYDRSRRLALLVGGSCWPHGRPPVEAPEVFVLGDVRYLVSRFRHDLITYRDLAVLAREAEAEAG